MTHNTHNNQHEPLPPYSKQLCPLSPWQHRPWTRTTAPRLPMSPMQASVLAGTSCRSVSFAWGAKLAPIEKEREGRDLDLRLPPLDGGIQQPLEGRRWRRIRGGGTVCWAITKGWDVFPSFGGSNKRQKKIK